MRFKQIFFVLLAGLGIAGGIFAQTDPAAGEPSRGLRFNSEASAGGFTLFAPLIGRTVYLIDEAGEAVHEWALEQPTSQEPFLLEDGSLIVQTTAEAPLMEMFGQVGGVAGRVERIGVDGDLLWAFEYAGETYQQHHDIEVLPNGNILLIAWEVLPAEDALAAGMRPELLPENGTIWPDQIVEIEPTSGEVVWTWRVWDHLVQDTDPELPNYGVVSEHPERIDVNFVGLRRLGDWQHSNALDYNPELDQILISVRHFSEIWVIDHSTTAEEARGDSGGRSGQGGDLLYRWGNPETYQGGTAEGRVLFAQHDAQWIEPGLPGAGNILIFNNGDELADRLFSDALEIVPPLDEAGNYVRTESGLAPAAIVWEYHTTPVADLFAPYVSSVQRLANGNTLIVNGTAGQMLEVTPDGDLAWEYLNPFGGNMPEQDPFGPYSVFRARRYAPDYPGLLALGLGEAEG